MSYPIKRSKTKTPKIDDMVQVIEGQGEVPLRRTENVTVPGAPSRGEMKVRGFNAMLRSKTFRIL